MKQMSRSPREDIGDKGQDGEEHGDDELMVQLRLFYLGVVNRVEAKKNETPG